MESQVVLLFIRHFIYRLNKCKSIFKLLFWPIVEFLKDCTWCQHLHDGYSHADPTADDYNLKSLLPVQYMLLRLAKCFHFRSQIFWYWFPGRHWSQAVCKQLWQRLRQHPSGHRIRYPIDRCDKLLRGLHVCCLILLVVGQLEMKMKVWKKNCI